MITLTTDYETRGKEILEALGKIDSIVKDSINKTIESGFDFIDGGEVLGDYLKDIEEGIEIIREIINTPFFTGEEKEKKEPNIYEAIKETKGFLNGLEKAYGNLGEAKINVLCAFEILENRF